ncbi:unnamed protein product [Gadus morhua 'NCC']
MSVSREGSAKGDGPERTRQKNEARECSRGCPRCIKVTELYGAGYAMESGNTRSQSDACNGGRGYRGALPEAAANCARDEDRPTEPCLDVASCAESQCKENLQADTRTQNTAPKRARTDKPPRTQAMAQERRNQEKRGSDGTRAKQPPPDSHRRAAKRNEAVNAAWARRAERAAPEPRALSSTDNTSRR